MPEQTEREPDPRDLTVPVALQFVDLEKLRVLHVRELWATGRDGAGHECQVTIRLGDAAVEFEAGEHRYVLRMEPLVSAVLAAAYPESVPDEVPHA